MSDKYEVKRLYLECACTHPDHTCKFEYDKEYLTLYIQLRNAPFLYRLKVALFYVLGIFSERWYWGDVLWPNEEIDKIENFLKEIRDERAKATKVSEDNKLTSN